MEVMQREVSRGSLGHTEQQVALLCIRNVTDPMLFSDVMFLIFICTTFFTSVRMALEMQVG